MVWLMDVDLLARGGGDAQLNFADCLARIFSMILAAGAGNNTLP